MRDEALVDVVKLLDQRLDAVGVERQGLHVRDDVVLERLVLALLGRRELLVLQSLLDVLDLEPAQLLVVVGDVVEGFEHARLQFRLHGGERHVVLHVVVVEVALRRGERFAFPFGLADAGAELRALAPAEFVHFRRTLAVRAGVGRLQVDDVAQEHPAFDQFVAPDDDRLEGQRAFAQPRDHGLAAGLDALGDGDLALARQKLDRAHLAKIHAHRIVGAVGRLLRGLRPHRDGAGRRRLGDVAALGLLLVAGRGVSALRSLAVLGLLGLDDVDAHLGELRQHVFDLVRVDLIGGQDRVHLVVGDVAALAGGLDHPLDRLIGQVQKRTVGLLLLRGRFGFVPFRRLRRHSLPL